MRGWISFAAAHGKEIFNHLKNDFINKYIDIYKTRRLFLEERHWSKISEEDFKVAYKWLTDKNTYLYNSHITKENKNIFF